MFYTADGEWIPAGDLEVGDELLSIRAEATVSGTVDSLEIIETTQTMYDLSVDTVYNFAVGDGQWVVHNCPDAPTPDEYAKLLEPVQVNPGNTSLPNIAVPRHCTLGSACKEFASRFGQALQDENLPADMGRIVVSPSNESFFATVNGVKTDIGQSLHAFIIFEGHVFDGVRAEFGPIPLLDFFNDLHFHNPDLTISFDVQPILPNTDIDSFIRS